MGCSVESAFVLSLLTTELPVLLNIMRVLARAFLALSEMSHVEIVSLLDCRRHPFLMLKSYC